MAKQKVYLMPSRYDTNCRTCGVAIKTRSTIAYEGAKKSYCPKEDCVPAHLRDSFKEQQALLSTFKGEEETGQESPEMILPANPATASLVRNVLPYVLKNISLSGSSEQATKEAAELAARKAAERATKDLTELVKNEIQSFAPKSTGQNQGRVIRLETPSKEEITHELEEEPHPALTRVLDLLTVSRPQNVLLVGPAGCGKGVLARQISKILSLLHETEIPFRNTPLSGGTSEGQLLGKRLPQKTGEWGYEHANFSRSWEFGGVQLLDEIDGADGNTLLVLNEAMASGKLSNPYKPSTEEEESEVPRHKHFYLIATANTLGTGADRKYTQRVALDDSTLDRFRLGLIKMTYSSKVEESILGLVGTGLNTEQQTDPTKGSKDLGDLLVRVRQLRDICESNNLDRTISTRFLADSRTMILEKDWSVEECLYTLISSWSEQDRSLVASTVDPNRVRK